MQSKVEMDDMNQEAAGIIGVCCAIWDTQAV